MQTLKAFATADPSFAGIGAYYSNVPMKVFMGNEPPLPLEVAAKALDSMQAGHAQPGHVGHAKKALQQDTCQKQCLEAAVAACSMPQQMGGAADSAYMQCMADKKKQCSSSCASVGGAPIGVPPHTKGGMPPVMPAPKATPAKMQPTKMP